MTPPKKKTAPAPAPAARSIPAPKPEDIKGLTAKPEVIDLDARAAARRAARKDGGPKIKVGTVTYELPAELQISTLERVFAVVDGDIGGIRGALVDLFGEEATTPPPEVGPEEYATLSPAMKREHTRRAKAYNPRFADLSFEDLAEVFGVFAEGYGIDLGNSRASTTS